jgi:hypothetical protein
MADVDWFGAGWAVYKGDVRDSEFFPPLNDMEAQRWWLGGFGAAWAEDLDNAVVASVLHGTGWVGSRSRRPSRGHVRAGRSCYGSCGVTGSTGGVGRCSRGAGGLRAKSAPVRRIKTKSQSPRRSGSRRRR